MLKVIPPTSSCGCGYFKSKCAEIHYQTSNFSILCIFCGLTTIDYADFLSHFQQQHFADFTKAVQCTAEPVVTADFEETAVSKRVHNDPLEFGERDITTDPEEVMKKLEAHELDGKEPKIEVAENFAQVEEHAPLMQNNCATVSGHEAGGFDASDEEYLICKVKVEQCNLQTINTKRLRRSRRTEKANTTTNTSVPNNTNTLAADEEFSDSNSASTLIGDTADSAEVDVDWSKPYEPNLLKNHDKRPYKPRNKPNICSYCGRTFRRRYQLDTHLNIHTGSKPHQCEICGRLFRAVTTLTRHLNTHEERELYNCKYCAKDFTHKAALLSHELRHTQERLIPCDECDKYFYTINQMDTHKRKVHHKADDEALPFACDLCAKRYRSASMLSTHKFKKHYKTAKYTCEQCGKKFIDEEQLEGHKVIHVNGLRSKDDSV